MNKQIIIGIIVFILILAAFVIFGRRIRKAEVPQKKKTEQTTSSRPTSERKIQVRLFFGSKNSTDLEPEGRAIVYHDDVHSQLREVLRSLLSGPTNKEFIATIPKGTQLRDLYVTADGTVYVDFSGEIVFNHQGGTQGEINTVYSIVNTITFNFPQMKKVQILVDDQAVETLKGHLDLSRPLQQDLTMVRIDTSTQTAKAS